MRSSYEGDRVREYHVPADDHTSPMSADVRRNDTSEGNSRVMFGHFARFGQWNEIRSPIEGHFLERVDRSAFDDTFARHGPSGSGSIRAIFDHGHDPSLGMKPIGVPTVLRADEHGPYYEAELFDGPELDLLVQGLAARAYGASYRFRVDAEQVVNEPGRSDHNPDGIPEVTILRATVREFGPTAFGADPMATAGVRSLTDQVLQVDSAGRLEASGMDTDQVSHEPSNATPALSERALRLRAIDLRNRT